MKIKTEDLTGAALDWAVAKCSFIEGTARSLIAADVKPYSTSWQEGGPIIEREIHSITDTTMRSDMSFAWEAKIHVGAGLCVRMHGPTPLIAAMRCFVASKMGDTIDIPEELV